MGQALYVVGDVRDVLETLEDESIDLAVTSPPFLGLRSYLPEGHPAKDREIGSEPTPGDFLQTQLIVVSLIMPKLSRYGSIAFEYGDSFAGSGGAGGDYNEGGMREGQPKFRAGYVRNDRENRPPQVSQKPRSNRPKYQNPQHDGGPLRDRAFDEAAGVIPTRTHTRKTQPGWPMDKSLCGIPHLFAWSLAYGFNLLTGEPSPAGMWRVRNVVCWARPNPPVGALGDKLRPATSYMTIATLAGDRYWDADAIRTVPKYDPESYTGGGGSPRHPAPKGHSVPMVGNAAGAPAYDWWEPLPEEREIWDAWENEIWQIPTKPYKGAHFATFPPALVVRPIESMCPKWVCNICGEPRRRLVQVSHQANRNTNGPQSSDRKHLDGGSPGFEQRAERVATTIGWSHCGCGDGCEATTWRTETVEVTQGLTDDGHWVDVDDLGETPEKTRVRKKNKKVIDNRGCCNDDSHWRLGMVLDPFVGSGTTLAVATGHGRDAIGIDIDARNVELARHRVGPMFFDVKYLTPAEAA